MRKLILMCALSTAPACVIACNGSEDNPKPDGDGDGDDDSTCSPDELEIPVGGAGGGGAPGVTCETPEPPEVDIELTGSFTDQYAGTYDIDTTVVDLGFSQFTLSLVNNEENYAVARNAETDLYNPCAFSLFVWHEEGSDIYWCQTVFNATSECAAEEAKRPDTSDLETGCNGFSWSQLTED